MPPRGLVGAARRSVDLGELEAGRSPPPARTERSRDPLGELHRAGLGHAVGLGRRRRETLRLVRRLHRVREDQEAPEIGRHRGAERVDGLGQREAAGRRLGPAEHRHERIGGDLQERDPGGQHEQRQENTGTMGTGGREERQATEPGRAQSYDDAGLVPELLDEGARGQGDDEIRREEGELHQHGLGVVQLERTPLALGH